MRLQAGERSMTNKLWRTAVIAAALLTPVLASAQDVKTDWDRMYDFSTVKTFAVKLGTSWGNPLSENRVSADLADTLKAKGWQQAPEAMADAVVVFHGATQTQHDINTFYTGWGGWGYRGVGGATTTVTDYLVGTLVVDIFDAKKKSLVFRGTASDEISNDPQKNQKKVEKATDKMFKNFPPGKKS